MLPNSSEAIWESQQANPRGPPLAMTSVCQVVPPSVDQEWKRPDPASTLFVLVMFWVFVFWMAMVLSFWFPDARLMLTFFGTGISAAVERAAAVPDPAAASPIANRLVAMKPVMRRVPSGMCPLLRDRGSGG